MNADRGWAGHGGNEQVIAALLAPAGLGGLRGRALLRWLLTHTAMSKQHPT